ncbi:influenza virus NS1A-binding protein isoform X1, partial [Sigmodon hispidus]
EEGFLKLPRLKLEVMLEDNVCLPSNGKLYTKVINWVQRSIWENGDSLEEFMEEVQTLYYSADYKLLDGNPLDGQAEVFDSDDDHI